MAQALSSRFFNPLMLWADVAVTTQEMWVSSASVVQARTERMALAGLAPNQADMAEFQLMVQEKVAAVGESGNAIVSQFQTSGLALLNRAIRQWFSGAAAFAGLLTSVTPAQAWTQGDRLLDVGTQAAVTVSQLSSAAARVTQRGLETIHAKATANARRLSQTASA